VGPQIIPKITWPDKEIGQERRLQGKLKLGGFILADMDTVKYGPTMVEAQDMLHWQKQQLLLGSWNLERNYFFPDGHSTKEPAEDFTFDICDFKMNKILLDNTVGQMYEQTKLKLVRFYICTKEGASTDHSSTEENDLLEDASHSDDFITDLQDRSHSSDSDESIQVYGTRTDVNNLLKSIYIYLQPCVCVCASWL